MGEKRFAWFRPDPRLWVLVGLALLLVSTAQAGTERGLLWRVEGAGPASHLFGTIHSDDPRVLDLPPRVRQALADSDRLVLEMTLDEMSMASVGRAMFYTEGGSLSGEIGPELYKATVEAMAERGYPESVVAVMRPWAVVATLSMPPGGNGQFLDRYLMQLARESGKPVHGLESVEEQVAVLGGLSVQDQALMLEETLDQLEALDDQFERLLDLYLAGDLEGLRRFQQDLYRDSDSRRIAELFEERAIRRRNHLMLDRMQTHLDAGRAFVAVGALHLPGPEGLISLLREQGLRVEPIY